jgi:cyanophycinase
LSHRFSVAFVLVCASCLGAQAGETAGFPWIDASGVRAPVLLCAAEPADNVRQQFEKLADGKPGRIVVIREKNGDRGVPAELTNVIVRAGELNDAEKSEIAAALAQRPEQFAVWLSPQAALAVYDRRLHCLGEGNVTIFLPASPGRPLRQIELKPGMPHDLTMLRRAAVERSLGNFPPIAPPVPNVSSGTLLIHGGGEMPKDVTDRFIELAGGPDAPIVVLPIAAEGSLPEDESRDTRVWTRVGAKNVRSLRARSRAEVESPEFAAAIENAKAVWFSGGRQWRFVDAYMGTKAEELFRGVLARGGVIGGSSAGASIQSQYMPRGSALGNTDMMAEGYERGLGFLPGAAVDQHFTQRKRHGDMTALMRRYPQILGIGLDEGTAIVVSGSAAQVIGRGGVHFYDYRTGQPAGAEDFALVRAGERYDLAGRSVVEQ